MSHNVWLVILLIVPAVGFALYIGLQPNLRLDWKTLSSLLRDLKNLEVIDLHNREKDVEYGVQLRTPNESVKYYHMIEGQIVYETLDVFKLGHFGFVAYFWNGEVIGYKRIGGKAHRASTLKPEQITVLLGLLNRARALALKHVP